MKQFLIAPSILSANFAELGKDVSTVLSAGADMLHFDVMDNHFVPNLSMGAMILRSLRKYGINVFVDVHLMANPIDRLILDFAAAGSNSISFHPESTDNINKSLQLIKKQGCEAGLVFNPSTSIDCLDDWIYEIDSVTLMSVNPGFGGQLFLTDVLEKIFQVRKLIDKTNHHVNLAVDGGINIKNFKSIVASGANIFVIGSAIFNSPNYVDSIRVFRSFL